MRLFSAIGAIGFLVTTAELFAQPIQAYESGAMTPISFAIVFAITATTTLLTFFASTQHFSKKIVYGRSPKRHANLVMLKSLSTSLVTAVTSMISTLMFLS